ncbi:hypothetical protein D3C86_1510220 [compost metagenome]
MVFVALFRKYDILINLPQSRAHRCHFGCAYVFRNGILCLLDAFRYLGSGPIDVYILFKNDGHDAQPETADGTQFDDFGNRLYSLFDRIGDKLLYFLRSQSRRARNDLYLVVGNVWQGIDRKVVKRIASHNDQCQRKQSDNKFIMDAEMDNLV